MNFTALAMTGSIVGKNVYQIMLFGIRKTIVQHTSLLCPAAKSSMLFCSLPILILFLI